MVLGIFRKMFGGEAEGRDKDLPAVRRAPGSGDDGGGSERRSQFEDFERETKEWRRAAPSQEMPGQAYFSQLQALQESISDRRYPEAANAARKSLPLIRKWLEDPRGNGKRLSLNMPALAQGGTMLAITGDRKGLAMLLDLVSESMILRNTALMPRSISPPSTSSTPCAKPWQRSLASCRTR